MTGNHQKDLFTFGPFGKKPLKEQVTPHKISLMVLVHEYIEMRRRQKPTVFVGFGSQDSGGEDKFKEREKRDFMTSILKLIQVNCTYICHGLLFSRGSRDHDLMVVGFTTTYAIGAYPTQARCTRYNIIMIKFVSDLRYVGGFFRVLFPQPIKLTATI